MQYLIFNEKMDITIGNSFWSFAGAVIEVRIHMGFDIYALDEDDEEIAYFRSHAGGFNWLNDEGYDWFALINAKDCDGGCSGTGAKREVQLEDLQYAMLFMDNLEAIGPSNREIALITDKYSEDDVIYIAIELYGFMLSCVKGCARNGKQAIKISFE